jgi:flavin-dependent dehydrogenase
MIASVDVAIAGAGPAGVATALGCARRGLEVALLDRARFPRDKPCGEGLLPAAVAALDELGLLAEARRAGCLLEGIGFSIPSGPSASARFCDRAGEPAFGLGCARRTLDALLVDAARAQPGITVLEGVAAIGPVRERGRVVGLRSSAGAIEARVVVGADGLRSPLRAQLGLAARTRAEPRLGLRVHLALAGELPFGRRVQVLVDRALEYYLTPVGARALQVAVLGSRAAFAAAGLSAPSLLAHLAAHPELARVLEGAAAIDHPLGAGPFRQRARSVVTDGALLVGDAAGYLDAITGEGIDLALRSGSAAARTIAALLLAGRAADARALRPYAHAHAAIVRDAERLTRFVLLLARHPWLARRAISALDRTPALFGHLLQVQAGAPFATLPPRDWALLVAG